LPAAGLTVLKIATHQSGARNVQSLLTTPNRPNDIRPSVAYKKLFWFQRNLVCRQRSMVCRMPYPRSRSRSRTSESCDNGRFQIKSYLLHRNASIK